MKVALVCDWFHPRVGGIELHLQDLAIQLVANGHEVVIVTPTPGADTVSGLRVKRIAASLAPVFGFLWTPAGARAVGEALVDEGVDIAHCHVSIVSPTAFCGAFQAQRDGIPTAITFHSVVPNTALLARTARYLFGTAAWPVRFSAVSNRVARDVRGIAGAQPMTLLPNGIEAGFWRVTPTPTVAGTLRLVSVMRLNPKKRPLALVGLMRRLDDALPPETRATLRIVGDGPQRGALNRAIGRAGLSDRIELLGRRSREEIRDILADSDVFVLPTIRESFGLAALEAKCAGLPVVAMASSGVAEIIEHGCEGLLARTDAGLATHVAALARDTAQRQRMAKHNRETIPPFDWPRVIAAHVALYREAIALRESV